MPLLIYILRDYSSQQKRKRKISIHKNIFVWSEKESICKWRWKNVFISQCLDKNIWKTFTYLHFNAQSFELCNNYYILMRVYLLSFDSIWRNVGVVNLFKNFGKTPRFLFGSKCCVFFFSFSFFQKTIYDVNSTSLF